MLLQDSQYINTEWQCSARWLEALNVAARQPAHSVVNIQSGSFHLIYLKDHFYCHTISFKQCSTNLAAAAPLSTTLHGAHK